MAKTVVGMSGQGKDGRRRTVDHSRVPKGMRRADPDFDVVTFTEGPLRRWFGRR